MWLLFPPLKSTHNAIHAIILLTASQCLLRESADFCSGWLFHCFWRTHSSFPPAASHHATSTSMPSFWPFQVIDQWRWAGVMCVRFHNNGFHTLRSRSRPLPCQGFFRFASGFTLWSSAPTTCECVSGNSMGRFFFFFFFFFPHCVVYLPRLKVMDGIYSIKSQRREIVLTVTR